VLVKTCTVIRLQAFIKKNYTVIRLMIRAGEHEVNAACCYIAEEHGLFEDWGGLRSMGCLRTGVF
jgi:hypothetical protein